MMSLEEQKLAVCEKLQLIELREVAYDKHPGDMVCKLLYVWKNPRHEINWPTEGLKVCHEAEKLLTEAERMVYGELMWQLTTGDFLDYSGVYYAGETPTMDYKELFPAINATYEQRLEALCKVWFPEKWKD